MAEPKPEPLDYAPVVEEKETTIERVATAITIAAVMLFFLGSIILDGGAFWRAISLIIGPALAASGLLCILQVRKGRRLRPIGVVALIGGLLMFFLGLLGFLGMLL
jgi:hypothetical protein